MQTMWVPFDRVAIQKIDLLDKSMYCKARDKPISLQVCLKNTEYDTKWGPLRENRASRCYEIGWYDRPTLQ